MLHIRLLGGFAIQNDAMPLTGFHSERLQALLAYLVLHRDAPMTRQQLAYTFWADTTDAQARTNLRTLLARFRDALSNADEFVCFAPQTIQWRADAAFHCDVIEFQNARAAALEHQRAGETAREMDALERAVKTYAGDLLPSCYDDWILPERETLRQEWHAALENLVARHEANRAYARALEYAQHLLRADPLREEAYARVMRLELERGERTSALRAYHACATMLRDEFGIDPAAETRALYLQLLRVDQANADAQTTPRGQAPLIGRDAEWARLLDAWERAAQGQTHFVLLAGEAGIGKTRLAEDFAAWAARQEIVTLTARGYENTQTSAFAPLAEWLRHDAVRQNFKNLERAILVEISRIAPSLRAEFSDLPEPPPITEAWQRQRLFEALARALLSAPAPRVLFLDDAQWCDAETLEWLQFVARFDCDTPLLILACARREEVDAAHPLTKWKLALHRAEQLTEIALPRLNEIQTLALASEWMQETMDDADAQALFQETEGNPLFVIEMVRDGGWGTGDRGWGTGDGGRRTTNGKDALLPQKIQSVIQHRLALLSPNARGLAEVASVLGREFSFEVLAQASGSELDALVRGLDELWRKQIVREQRGEAYDFAHDKIRAAAYNSLSAARQKILHLRAADALVNVHSENMDAWSGQIAQQYERAQQPKQAIDYYLRAADAAKRVYAVQDTIQFYQRALALLSRGDERAAELNHALGDALLMGGQFNKARNVFDVALASTPPADTRARAQLVTKRGSAWSSQRETSAALQEYELAEATQGEPSADWRAKDWAVWIQRQLAFAEAYYFAADNANNAQVLQRAQPLVEKNGTPHQQIQFLRALGRYRTRLERFVPSDMTLALSQEIVQACENFGDKGELASARFNLGFMRLWRGELEDAERELHIARAAAEAMHYTHLNVLCQVYLTIAHRKRGTIELAKEYARSSAALAEQMDIREYKSAAQANFGWIEWRAGNFQLAQKLCQDALPKFAKTYPFHWFASGPLLGIALERAEWGAAIEYVRAMLTPPQQLLPEPIASGFARAVAFWDAGDTLRARQELEHIAADAKLLGYL
ncbi:MAG: hypothetical protein EYC68_08205 [Chloroflexota bacterium]|nr:MAG: hypothetical protein EYC68_08205 [Chloroflexota bacterium]